MKKFTLALVFLMPLLPTPATAQDVVTAINVSARSDYEQALELIASLAERGDALAAYKLGTIYNEGEEVKQDFMKAANYFGLAAAQGYAPAQYSLGIKYEKGQGVPLSHSVAAMWYRRSAEQNHADAQYRLGRMFVQGQGVERDYMEAVKWFDLAAAQGIEDATVAREAVAEFLTPEQLAELPTPVADVVPAVEPDVEPADVQPAEVKPDAPFAGPTQASVEPAEPNTESVKLSAEPKAAQVAQIQSTTKTVQDGSDAYNAGDFRSAHEIWAALAEAGNRSAQFHLGAIIFEGRVMPENYSKAHYWLQIAAYRGDERAKPLAASAAEKLSSEEVSASDAAALDWLQSRSIEVSKR